MREICGQQRRHSAGKDTDTQTDPDAGGHGRTDTLPGSEVTLPENLQVLDGGSGRGGREKEREMTLSQLSKARR